MTDLPLPPLHTQLHCTAEVEDLVSYARRNLKERWLCIGRPRKARIPPRDREVIESYRAKLFGRSSGARWLRRVASRRVAPIAIGFAFRPTW